MMRFLPAVLLATACGPADPIPTEPSPTEVTQPRATKAAPARPEFPGVVTSRKSTVISARVAARIDRFVVTPGQAVKAGELVATLDDTELKTKLSQARSAEKGAQMEAGAYGSQAAALGKKARVESLLQQRGFSSPMAVLSARAEAASVGSQGGAAMARAIGAKAAREQAEKDLAASQIVAPIDGIVTNIKAHVGDATQIGSPLARVFDPSDLIIRFAVPKEHRAAIALGQRVELTVDSARQPIIATVTNISGAQEPPINFTVVEADIDDSKIPRGEITVASVGRVRIADVRIADARGAKQ
ncbi:MAG TPA: HlyD family efflux transporter periplasmic adaptor subunit [Kofleriaceae bacterium]|nr:HlyD family efflux transporter periplasmic adaptor subunit [Kofleriaceae bacterium]